MSEPLGGEVITLWVQPVLLDADDKPQAKIGAAAPVQYSRHKPAGCITQATVHIPLDVGAQERIGIVALPRRDALLSKAIWLSGHLKAVAPGDCITMRDYT